MSISDLLKSGATIETIATALDPYPRKEGAEFRADGVKSPGPGEAGPFAALKRLKDQA